MIRRKFKCIFIEVPKTGSTSIREIIGEPDKAHLDILEYKQKILSGFPFNAPETSVIKNMYNTFCPNILKQKIGENIFNEYYKFGFVRNPWSRVVSLYLRKESVQMRDKMTFEEFVSWIQYSSDTCVHPSPKLNQLDWFLDEHGNIAVDFIGKFEHLESDWSKIAQRIHANPILPHANFNHSSQKTITLNIILQQPKRLLEKNL